MIAQTDRQKVLAVHPFAVACYAQRKHLKRLWYIVVGKETISARCATEAAAWTSALRRLETGRR